MTDRPTDELIEFIRGHGTYCTAKDGRFLAVIDALTRAQEARRNALLEAAKVAREFRLPSGNLSDFMRTNESYAEAQRRLIAVQIEALIESSKPVKNKPSAIPPKHAIYGDGQ